MKAKDERLEALKMIVSSQQLSNQKALQSALKSEGISLSQTTLSRYMKQLKLVKVSDNNGNYFYQLPENSAYRRVRKPSTTDGQAEQKGFQEIMFSGNMGVIKTSPGYAGGIAYHIDASHIEEIIGTIAGDDTIFIVLKEDASKVELMKKLNEIVHIV